MPISPTRLTPLLLPLILLGCAHKPILIATGQPPGLLARGTGEATAPPDIATLNLGVEVRNHDAQQASAQAAAQMQQVIAALKAAGVAAEDLQTSNLSLHYIQPPEPTPAPSPALSKPGAPPSPPSTPKGQYIVRNTLQATLRNLDEVSNVIEAATTAGANQMHGLRFELEHPEHLLAQARADAVQQAKVNAQSLAKQLNVELRELLSIQESESGVPLQRSMLARSESLKAGPPVEQGSITVRHSVELLYGLP